MPTLNTDTASAPEESFALAGVDITRLNTYVDRSVHPQAGAVYLEEFLDVFLTTRGYPTYVHWITVLPHESNVIASAARSEPYDEATCNPATRALHLLQVKLLKKDYDRYKSALFNALQNIFSTTDQSSADAFGFSLEPRWQRVSIPADQSGEVIVQMSLYLHNVSLLIEATKRLNEERDANESLFTSFNKRLMENDQDALAWAAQHVHSVTEAAIKAQKISPPAGMRICYLTRITMEQPTPENVLAFQALLEETQLGEWNQSVVISGAVLAFLGLAALAALLVIVHTSIIALPVLVIVSAVLSATTAAVIGAEIVDNGLKETGVKLSLRNFFTRLPKQEQAVLNAPASTDAAPFSPSEGQALAF